MPQPRVVRLERMKETGEPVLGIVCATAQEMHKHAAEIQQRRQRPVQIDILLDESLLESFPASDPPSQTILTKIEPA
jgi:hypothetical protein